MTMNTTQTRLFSKLKPALQRYRRNSDETMFNYTCKDLEALRERIDHIIEEYKPFHSMVCDDFKIWIVTPATVVTHYEFFFHWTRTKQNITPYDLFKLKKNPKDRAALSNIMDGKLPTNSRLRWLFAQYVLSKMNPLLQKSWEGLSVWDGVRTKLRCLPSSPATSEGPANDLQGEDLRDYFSYFLNGEFDGLERLLGTLDGLPPDFEGTVSFDRSMQDVVIALEALEDIIIDPEWIKFFDSTIFSNEPITIHKI